MDSTPVERFREGAVEATVWDNGKWLSVSFKRSYKDKNSGEWKTAHTYGLRDLRKLRTVLDQAGLYLRDHEENDSG